MVGQPAVGPSQPEQLNAELVGLFFCGLLRVSPGRQEPLQAAIAADLNELLIQVPTFGKTLQALADLIRVPYKWSECSLSECSQAVNNPCSRLGSPCWMPTSRNVFMSTSSGQPVDPAGVQHCQDALGFPVAAVVFKALSPVDIF